MSRRTAVLSPDDQFHLGEYSLGHVRGGADEGESSHTFAVEPEVLRVGLGNKHLQAFFQEDVDRFSIFLQVSRCITNFI